MSPVTLAWIPVAVFGLVSLRLMGVLLLLPGGSWIPWWLRGWIALALAWVAEPLSLPRHGVPPLGLAWIVGALIAFATGLLMGVLISWAFAALTTVGSLLMDLLGVGLAGPTPVGILSGSSGFSSWLSWLGLLVFLHQDGLDLVVTAWRASLIAWPVTHWAVSPAVWLFALRWFGTVLAAVWLLAAPVIAAVLTVWLVMAVVSRGYPQMPIYFVASPVVSLAAIGVLWAMMPWLVPLLINWWQTLWTAMSHVLTLS